MTGCVYDAFALIIFCAQPNFDQFRVDYFIYFLFNNKLAMYAFCLVADFQWHMERSQDEMLNSNDSVRESQGKPRLK